MLATLINVDWNLVVPTTLAVLAMIISLRKNGYDAEEDRIKKNEKMIKEIKSMIDQVERRMELRMTKVENKIDALDDEISSLQTNIIQVLGHLRHPGQG